MLRRLADEMLSLVESHASAIVAPFLAEWPDIDQPTRPEPTSLPVVRWLPHLAEPADPRALSLVRLIVEHGDVLAWRQTYGAVDFGPDFLLRYGWTEIIGQRGVFSSDRIAAGFLLLGPELEYPFHSHDAEEIYIPLSGRTSWAAGDSGWQTRKPGDLIHHPSRVPHAMRTSAMPLLALYVWRAGNLTQKSIIEPAITDGTP